MDSSSASVSSPDESPHNDDQEEVLGSKEIIDQSQSNEGVDNHESSLSEFVRESPPRMSGSSENSPPPLPLPPPLPVDEQEERDYGCRYCEKFFSNKQALGGHMNAHKRERTIEKNILDQMGNSAYPPRNNFTGSLFNKSQGFFDRDMMNMPYIAQRCTTQHAMRYGRAPRPRLGINKGYPRWPMQRPGNVPQFFSRPESSRLENFPTGINFQTPTSVPNRKFLGESSNKQINGRETQGFEDDSGLDLTLRL